MDVAWVFLSKPVPNLYPPEADEQHHPPGNCAGWTSANFQPLASMAAD